MKRFMSGLVVVAVLASASAANAAPLFCFPQVDRAKVFADQTTAPSGNSHAWIWIAAAVVVVGGVIIYEIAPARSHEGSAGVNPHPSLRERALARSDFLRPQWGTER